MRVRSVIIGAALLMLGRSAPAQDSARGTLVAFRSDAEMHAYLHALIRGRMIARDSATRAWQRQRTMDASCRAGRTRQYFRRADSTAVIVARTVHGYTNRGLPGSFLSFPALRRTVTTDSAGLGVVVVPVPEIRAPRSLTLVVRRLGYNPDSLVLTVAAGDSIDLAFGMCQATTRLEHLVVSLAAVTNVHTAGVDEGGIVKLHGDFLVVLRRGRLHTVRVGPGAPRPVHTVNAFGPGIDPTDTWYDELLVAGDRVVVVGYSYDRGGTEVGVFRIDRRGRLHYLATHQLRSGDYYSSRNYASRLIGSKLILYAPVYIPDDTLAIAEAVPAMRTWRHRGAQGEFRPIVSARQVYRPVVEAFDADGVALHTVTTCDLAAEPLSCDARGFIGGNGREFYLSRNAVYVWVNGAASWRGAPSVVHRMPFDGSPATALRTSGGPVDQFSFLESDDAHLNVVVEDAAHGGAMWSSERPKWRLALLRVPLSAFGDGRDSAPASAYRGVAGGLPGATQNRFIGDWLVIGSGSGWMPQDRPRASSIYVTPWRGGAVREIALAHDVERIEAMGRDAVVIGADMSRLHFSAIALDDPARELRRYSIAGASQGETRSHGFFYKPSGDGGVLGLPVRGAGKPGWSHLFDESAAIVFLRSTPRGFVPLGRLDADPRSARDDRCVASCVDWYGNARPLFLGDRVFALLGSELVEGRESGGRLRPIRRVDISVR